MDRGEFVPDDITIRMLLDRLDAPDASRGCILDGFPRNRAQAEALDEALTARGARVEAALYIEVPEAQLLERLSGRWLCQAHGHTYHDHAYPPRTPGVCDFDGSPLIQRDDDRAEVVQARLEKQLAPLVDLVDYYRPRGLLRSVDGRRPIAAVTADLLDHIEARPYWRHP
jgi:adenylate kinase